MRICYRCSGSLLLVQTNSDIAFFACAVCKSQYTKVVGKELHDRWMMPITLPLYAVIFSDDPINEAERVARQFEHRDLSFKQLLITHILEELHSPKQKISEIHDYLCADESILRVFLGVFAEQLQAATEISD